LGHDHFLRYCWSYYCLVCKILLMRLNHVIFTFCIDSPKTKDDILIHSIAIKLLGHHHFLRYYWSFCKILMLRLNHVFNFTFCVDSPRKIGFLFFIFSLKLSFWVMIIFNGCWLQFMIMRRESGELTIADLSSKMSRLKVVGENLSEEERDSYINDLYKKSDEDVDFELFLKVSFYQLGNSDLIYIHKLPFLLSSNFLFMIYLNLDIYPISIYMKWKGKLWN